MRQCILYTRGFLFAVGQYEQQTEEISVLRRLETDALFSLKTAMLKERPVTHESLQE